MPHSYIRDLPALRALTERLRGAPRLAIDTEFVRERQYWPQLEIVQLATPDEEAILDFRALGTLEPVGEILHDRATLKLFHAGDQDLEIFYNLTGRVPAPVWDTQVAAAMVGLGAQVGYSRLVESQLGVTLSKSETLTDWARRPLSAAQVEYALNDVRFLLPLHDRLQAQLADLGRSDWLADEWAALTDPAAYQRVAPREAWRRVQGASRLRPRDLAILRELAEWRESEAARRDRAPSLIVRDPLLLELVKRAPASEAALAELRGLHPREIERHAGELLAAIQRGQALPRSEWPRPDERAELSEQQGALVALMQGWLRARADELRIAPSYLATAADLRELVAAAPNDRARLAVLHGWRRPLVGEELLAIVEGRALLKWQPDTQRIELRRPTERADG